MQGKDKYPVDTVGFGHWIGSDPGCGHLLSLK
jgi:hypothetical protein